MRATAAASLRSACSASRSVFISRLPAAAAAASFSSTARPAEVRGRLPPRPSAAATGPPSHAPPTPLPTSAPAAQLPVHNEHRSNAEAMVNALPVILVQSTTALCDGGGGATGHPVEYMRLDKREGGRATSQTKGCLKTTVQKKGRRFPSRATARGPSAWPRPPPPRRPPAATPPRARCPRTPAAQHCPASSSTLPPMRSACT